MEEGTKSGAGRPAPAASPKRGWELENDAGGTSVEPDACLHLPAPSKLGGASALPPGPVQAVARDFLKLAPVRLSGHLHQQLHAIGNALAGYFAGLGPAAEPTGLNEKQEHYDSHFRVIRADGDAANLLAAATIAAFC